MQGITPCLWFDDQAEEAAEYYVRSIPNSRITAVHRWEEPAASLVGRPAGQVLLVTFELLGQPFMALNGGPEYRATPATSFVLNCETQAEVDTLWDALADGGETMACGWLTDRFGITWQITPIILPQLLFHRDPAVRGRVTEAMHAMVKLDIAALEAAAAG